MLSSLRSLRMTRRGFEINNYDRMLLAARQRFLEYDSQALGQKPGVTDLGSELITDFLGQRTVIRKEDGQILLDGRIAGFGEGLSVLDWLCDRKPDATASLEFCPIGSLPGVYVGGGNLSMDMPRLAMAIDRKPEKFQTACLEIGGLPEKLGDLGFQLKIFPDLPMCLKFYFGDEEFPPQLTLLWDRNMLRFVRYETVYYIAGCLQARLLQLMER